MTLTRTTNNDRDAGTMDEGMFGINIHRSRKW